MNMKDAQLYEVEIDEIKQELAQLPEGRLSKKGAQYYVTIDSVQKGITRDRQKVMQLARKAYLSRRLKHLEWNCSLIKKHAYRFKTEDPMEIIWELPAFYQKLPVSYFYHPSVHEQLNYISVGIAWHEEELIYLTNSGIRVRSKSERTIAEALDQKGIPYRYEAALALGGAKRYPDFTINRPSDGKMFLWEHFGLMNDDGYRQKAVEKLALYAKYGFSPFDSLICTYEQDMQNPAHIYGLIELFLLRQF